MVLSRTLVLVNNKHSLILEHKVYLKDTIIVQPLIHTLLLLKAIVIQLYVHVERCFFSFYVVLTEVFVRCICCWLVFKKRNFLTQYILKLMQSLFEQNCKHLYNIHSPFACFLLALVRPDEIPLYPSLGNFCKVRQLFPLVQT